MAEAIKHDYKFGVVDGPAVEKVITTLRSILKKAGKAHMIEEVIFFIRELMTNANKANLKKVHFRLNDLDLYNADDYKKGMASFAQDFHDKLEEYNGHIAQGSYYTEVEINDEDHTLAFKVKNSGELTKQETHRVDDLIEKSRSIRDIAQAYMLFADETEGAGMGTISIMLMLRSLGLDENSYHFYSDPIKKETVFRIEVPYSSISEKQTEEVTNLIFKEIDTLPIFPENLAAMQKLLSDPDVHLQDVAQVIEKDFTLSTEILKIVNSAQYMLPNQVSNINNAVSLLGLKGLKNLILSFGTQKIMSKKYGQLASLWEHSYRTASYAYNMAKKYKMASKADDAYIGGILHDVGKVLVSHIYPDLLKTITQHCKNMGYGSYLMESLAIGGAHDRIGEEITAKWNFPAVITEMIGYHHKPLLASEDNADQVSLVYLANLMAHLHDGEYLHAGLEPAILQRFGLTSEAKVKDLEKDLNKQYEQQQMKG